MGIKIGAFILTNISASKSARMSEFVQSELFARTFREGMGLVEETANYLDGEGREASKALDRDAALSYASASMRLTTQLMQIASWLLVLRAVREDEMHLAEAAEEKYRINSNSDGVRDFDATAGLPTSLIGLMDGAEQLFSRIYRLDRDLFGNIDEVGPDANDAMGQQKALMEAFGAKR